MISSFTDRAAAGKALAQRLQVYAGRGDVVVMALVRGGVPVAAEVAILTAWGVVSFVLSLRLFRWQ